VANFDVAYDYVRGAFRCALYARALFGMSLSLISESVREELAGAFAPALIVTTLTLSTIM